MTFTPWARTIEIAAGLTADTVRAGLSDFRRARLFYLSSTRRWLAADSIGRPGSAAAPAVVIPPYNTLQPAHFS